MNVPRLLIAGTHSGAGKTSVTLGLIGALRRRGTVVQPFKVGPDFNDSSLLTAVSGRPSRNLDTWMLPKATVLELFVRGSDGAGLALVEGVMGLYDGYRGGGDEGSTAEVAKLLHAPVVLVVDVSGSVRSAAATALGFVAFDPAVTIAGVIADRVGGERHLGWLRDALAGAGIPLLGAMPWDERMVLPERYLGLVPAAERNATGAFEALADAAVRHIDLDAIVRIARQAPPVIVPGQSAFPAMIPPPSVSIGIARDRAFHFYYQDSLDLLASRGAALVPFSPLADARLPRVDGLYLGGGYPELYAEELAANGGMLHEVTDAISDGMPVYAECGGMTYLARELVDLEGREHALAGVLPISVKVHRSLAAIGYVTLTAEADSVLLRDGEIVRGHEFHSSTVTPHEPLPLAFRVAEGRGMVDGHDGVTMRALLASYTHLHFASKPVMAERFVDACKRHRTGNKTRRPGNEQ